MKNKYNRTIFFEEYVHINGIDHYLLHSGTKYSNPLMLFLHGGPGFAESTMAMMDQPNLFFDILAEIRNEEGRITTIE